jgi:methionyl-tRNA synthetase
VPYFLSKYDPDPLRFYLTATAPETRDTEFSWEDFVERNNNELVATWGNLDNRPRGTPVRMLSFATKRCDSRRRSSRSWMRAWLKRNTRGWKDRRARIVTESRGISPALSAPQSGMSGCCAAGRIVVEYGRRIGLW